MILPRLDLRVPTRDVLNSRIDHKGQRCVIETQIRAGEHLYTAEITLTNRDTMRFRMLLGRNALYHRCIIDPVQSYLLGEPSASGK